MVITVIQCDTRAQAPKTHPALFHFDSNCAARYMLETSLPRESQVSACLPVSRGLIWVEYGWCTLLTGTFHFWFSLYNIPIGKVRGWSTISKGYVTVDSLCAVSFLAKPVAHVGEVQTRLAVRILNKWQLHVECIEKNEIADNPSLFYSAPHPCMWFDVFV